jgi:hypothetical protein
MLHEAHNIGEQMAKGHSGRIVIEVDPALKRELYGALAVDDSTMKDWFLAHAGEYLSSRNKNATKKAVEK